MLQGDRRKIEDRQYVSVKCDYNAFDSDAIAGNLHSYMIVVRGTSSTWVNDGNSFHFRHRPETETSSSISISVVRDEQTMTYTKRGVSLNCSMELR